MTRRRIAILGWSLILILVGLYLNVFKPRMLVNLDPSKPTIATAEAASITQQTKLWLADNRYSSIPTGFTLADLTKGNAACLHPRHLIDPWDRPYVLVIVDASEFQVASFGADGRVGGRGDDADIAQ